MSIMLLLERSVRMLLVTRRASWCVGGMMTLQARQVVTWCNHSGVSF